MSYRAKTGSIVKTKYRVIGLPGNWAIAGPGGVIVFDMLSRDRADKITALCNQGIGPEWTAIQPYLEGVK